MTTEIKIDHADGITTLTLDRQAKKNSLTDAMYAAMADALDAGATDAATRVFVIRAEGEMFTAGNDVNEFAKIAMGGTGLDNVQRFLRTLASATKPVIAAVQGRAIGIGTTLLLHCDYVIVGEDAQLSTPFVNLALVPEAASSLLLPSRIGHTRAFAMFALGEPVTAQQAVAWGIANEIVPTSSLAAAARAVAARLAKQPLGALVATKQLMKSGEAVAHQMEVEGRVFLERLRSAEAKEAFMAFAQRRPADFSKF